MARSDALPVARSVRRATVRRVQVMFRIRDIGRTKTADLTGEDMLRFRHGKSLFIYCPDCSHSAVTPITGVLGCTKGDDAEVMDYSERLTKGETDEAVEKCPGFASRTTDEEIGPRQASKSQAAFVKEVPTTLINQSRSFRDRLDESLEQLEPEDRAEVNHLLDGTFKDEHKSQTDDQEDYDYADKPKYASSEPPEKKLLQSRERSTGKYDYDRMERVCVCGHMLGVHAAESPRPCFNGDISGEFCECEKFKPAKVKKAVDVSNESEQDEFFRYLAANGLSKEDSDEVAKSVILKSLMSWREGLLAMQTDKPTIDMIWDTYRNVRQARKV